MHAIVSLLPPPYYEEIQALWKDLEDRHGLHGIRVTPYPHFSWQIAEEYDFPRLEGLMQTAIQSFEPVVIRTAGVGIFSGPRPVLFLTVVKSPALMTMHELLWTRIGAAARGLSPHYDPEHWMPHISLAYEDLYHENIAGAIEEIGFRPFAWEMTIHNLALIYEPTGSVGELRYQYEF